MQTCLRRLGQADASLVESHLVRRDVDDRSLRFAAGLVTDATIRSYCARLRFEQDVLLGCFDAAGELIGVVHGCVYEVGGRQRIEAAFSVDKPHRREGIGTRLMQAIEAHACAMGVAALVGMCATRNLPMRRIFEQAGLTLSREDDELQARRDLQPVPA